MLFIARNNILLAGMSTYDGTVDVSTLPTSTDSVIPISTPPRHASSLRSSALVGSALWSRFRPGFSSCGRRSAGRSLRAMNRPRSPRRPSRVLKKTGPSPSPPVPVRHALDPDLLLSAEENATLLRGLGPLVPEEAILRVAQTFRVYLSELVAWNVRSNLVAAGDRDRLVLRHVVESLACVPIIDEVRATSFIDLGSGAGFPGIPIKLVRPSLRVALVESRRMKCLFLRRAAASLGLPEAVVWQTRVESLSSLLPHPCAEDPGSWTAPFELETPSYRPIVDLVTSRAVAGLEQVARWVAPLVRPGGHLITFKGSRAEEEIQSWKLNPGPWELSHVRQGETPGLVLVALGRIAEPATDAQGAPRSSE
jgi:16S rRNA (guanine527-N7)-methyltransferase